MKAERLPLKGKSVFIVSLLVVGITVLVVYLSGVSDQCSLIDNLFWSSVIIAAALFSFLFYGLYRGIALLDDFPTFKRFKRGDILSTSATNPDLPAIDAGDGIASFLMSIVL